MPSANKLFKYLFYLWRKHDVTLFFSRIMRLPIAHVTIWTATTHHFKFQSARHVATELIRPKSGGLCHLVWYSATCVWDQSSWHQWAVTASTACVMQLGAVADWWCSWPMPNTLCVLVFVPEADILNILCDYPFVFPVLDELYVSHRPSCSRWCSKSALYKSSS